MTSFKMKGWGALPVSLTAALAAFSLVAVFQLLIGQYKAELIVPFGILAALLAGYYAQRTVRENSLEKEKNGSIMDVIVLGGIIIWTIFNLLFTSEHLFTNRDPATYNLTGAWLVNHQSIHIDKPASLTTLNMPTLTAESLGFATNPHNSNEIEAQGAHLLPALQALAGKVAGINGVLRLNVIFGGTALLAFYGFSRLVVRPHWAALAALVMSLSLPMLFMSRDSYTEPLTMTFTFAGLSLLMYAQRARVPWQWFLAGLVLGATALTRIDAYLTFIGIGLFGIVWLMLAPKGNRSALLSCCGWLAGGMLIMGYIAWLDVSGLSSAYYQAHQKFILPELKLIVALSIVGAAAVVLNWRLNLLAKLDKFTKSWRDIAVFVGIAGFFLVLASRPAWFIGHQLNNGVEVRSFSEQTLNWIIWYIGPVTMVAGVAGLILAVSNIFKNQDRNLIPFISALSVTALLYLLSPNITGDQVWATRRLIPIVIPGFVLLSMWTYEKLFNKKRTYWRGRTYNLEIITTVLVTVSVLSPLFVTYPFALRRLYVPELSQIQAICRQLPQKAVVIWAGQARDFAVQPTRTVCGNDSIGLELLSDKASLNKASLAQLANQSKNANLPIVVGWFNEDSKALIPSQSVKPMPISSIVYNEIEHTYKRPPRNVITLHNTVLMGKLNTDGSITPLGATSN